MIDTKKPAPTSFSNSPSLSSTTHQQSKLTKKQKKASAFRDKSSRRKTKNIGPKHEQEVEMEDLHVFNMEEPSRARYASGSVQMGNEEGQATEGTERSKSTRASEKGPADSTRLVQQEICSQSQEQKSHPKRQRIAVGAEQRDGEYDEQDERRIKKRKRANMDAADERMDGKLEGGNAQEKGRNKKQKIEKAERGMDCAEGEGEGEEMSEDEGGEEGKQRREKQRFILFIGWSLSIQILCYSRAS